MNKTLPIHDVIPSIKSALKNNSKLIIEAPAGAGKSTVVPISLINEDYLENKKIVVLEPRRVAAKAVAQQMANLLGEKVGQTVGYQVKMDSCFSKNTKVLVVTEAILTRKLQSDQSIEDIGLIIFDEFHERSIHTDLSLALCLQVQELLRDDLKIVLMSATLNSQKLASLLGDIEVIKSNGRMYPVESIYLPQNIKHPNKNDLIPLIFDIVVQSIKNDEGDILVFLSGVKDINTLKNLFDDKLGDSIEVLPLHSNLSSEEQNRALGTSEKRKIILSTNIAQTSLTIQGIKVVIDSGLEKISRYDEASTMDYLELSFISEDSAIQREGRAGRLSEGKCYKLWHQNRILEKEIKPEILRVDLSSFLLDVSLWGCNNLDELQLCDIPNSNRVDSIKEILYSLDMIDTKGNITKLGRDSISLGMHPRLAYMVLKANDLGYAKEACIIASLLIEKDIFKNSYKSKDFIDRFDAVYDNKNININQYKVKQIIKQSELFYKQLKSIKDIRKSSCEFKKEMISVILLFAYPDRLAKQGDIKHRYKLSNAKSAIIEEKDSLYNNKFLVIPNLIAKASDSYINLACSISIADIKKYFTNKLEKKEIVSYDKQNRRLDIKESLFLLNLELESKNISLENSSLELGDTMLELVKEEGLELLNFDNKVNSLVNRVNLLKEHNIDIQLPDLSDTVLINSLDVWLKPYLTNVKDIKSLKSLDIYSILSSMIDWNTMQSIDELAPLVIKVPSGSKIKIDYSDSKVPKLSVKIQEIFGMFETPKILAGKLPLQIQLLSPAQRPIQITYDLKSFWENSYDEVRKELRGKYKKHYWPEDPFEAIATNKTKKFM